MRRPLVAHPPHPSLMVKGVRRGVTSPPLMSQVQRRNTSLVLSLRPWVSLGDQREARYGTRRALSTSLSTMQSASRTRTRRCTKSRMWLMMTRRRWRARLGAQCVLRAPPLLPLASKESSPRMNRRCRRACLGAQHGQQASLLLPLTLKEAAS